MAGKLSWEEFQLRLNSTEINSRLLCSVHLETCNKLTITGPKVYASYTVSYVPSKWHPAYLEPTSFPGSFFPTPKPWKRPWEQGGPRASCVKQPRDPTRTDVNSGTFRTFSERFGYLRFITREETSVRIAFVKILENLVLEVKTKNLQQSFFSW